MTPAAFPRSLVTALGGLVLGIVGFGWDRVWHSRHVGSQISGASEVLEAHWLMLLGVAIMFLALAATVRSVRQPRSAAVSTRIAFAGSLALVAGFAWDSVRHVQGTESPTAHSLIYAGLLLVVLALPAALGLSRRRAAPPEALPGSPNRRR